MTFGIVFFSSVVSAPLAGLFSAKRKSVRTPLIVGFLGLMIFNILMATTNSKASKSVFWGYPVLGGLGLGCVLPINMVAAQLSTPKELVALASGLIISFRSFGGSVGLAINSAIFSSTLSSNLPKKIAEATLPLGLPPASLLGFIGALAAGNVTAVEKVSGVTPQIIEAGTNALRDAYSIAFRNVWIAASCFTLIAIIGEYNPWPNSVDFGSQSTEYFCCSLVLLKRSLF
jgi:MFS family permease